MANTDLLSVLRLPANGHVCLALVLALEVRVDGVEGEVVPADFEHVRYALI